MSPDRRLLAAMGGAAFLMNAGAVLAWSALMGRFLARLGPGWMPVIYVAVNLVTIALYLVVAGRGLAAGRAGPRRAVLVASGALAVLATVPGRTHPAAIFGGFLLSWVYLVVFELEFWTWVSGVLPLRLAKRLTPGVGGLGTAGRIAGALLAADPFGWSSISRLLLLAAGLGLASLAFLGAATREAEDHPEGGAADAGPGEDVPAGLGHVAGRVARSPLLRRVMLLCFAAGFFKGTADYPLAVTAQATLQFEEELAAFFGLLGASVNGLAVLLQLVGTGPLLARLPLRRSVLLFPGSVALASLAGVVAPVFGVAVTVRFLQRLGNRAVHTPLVVLLGNPFPGAAGRPLRALAMGVSAAAGTLVAGVGLALAGPEGPPLAGVYLAMAGVGALGSLAAWRADAAYVRALVDVAGGSGGVDREGRGAPRTPLEAAARALLAGGAPADREDLLRALASPADLRSYLAALPPARRIRALELLLVEDLCEELAGEVAATLVDDAEGADLARVARLAGTLPGGSLVDAVERRFLALDGGEGSLALAGAVLRRGRDPAIIERAVRLLREARDAPDPRRRRRCLDVLGGLAHPVFAPTLVAGLEDPAPEVAARAARALVRARLPGTLGAVESARARAGDPALVAALSEAADRIRDHALGQVRSVLDSMDARERRRMAAGLRDLGVGRTLKVAAQVMAHPSREARGALVEVLRGRDDPGLLAAIEAATATEDAPLGDLLRWAMDSPEDPRVWDAVAALARGKARREELVMALERCLEGAPDAGVLCELLGALGRDPAAYRRARENLESGEARRVSAALELLAATVPAGPARARVEAALEELSEAGPRGSGDGTAPRPPRP